MWLSRLWGETKISGDGPRLAWSEDVVAWVVGGDRGAGGLGGDGAEAALLVVLEGLGELGLGVHDERAVGRDGFPDRLAAEQQDVEGGARAVHRLVGGERDRLA